MNCFTRYAFYDRHTHDYAMDWSVDILSHLPTELALHILMLLCTPLSPPASPAPDSTDLETYPYPVPDPDSLRSILACLSVSRKWRTLASDNSVWQALFLGRWAIDLRRANRPHKLIRQRCNKTARVDCKRFQRTISSDQRLLNKGCMVPQRTTNELPPLQSLPLSDFPPQRMTSVPDTFFLGPFDSFYVARPHLISARNAPLQLDWRRLYRERFELEKRWAGPARHTTISFPDESTMHTLQGFPNIDPRSKWDPKVMRIPGHSDRCVTRIYTRPSGYLIIV